MRHVMRTLVTCQDIQHTVYLNHLWQCLFLSLKGFVFQYKVFMITTQMFTLRYSCLSVNTNIPSFNNTKINKHDLLKPCFIACCPRQFLNTPQGGTVASGPLPSAHSPCKHTLPGGHTLPLLLLVDRSTICHLHTRPTGSCTCSAEQPRGTPGMLPRKCV